MDKRGGEGGGGETGPRSRFLLLPESLTVVRSVLLIPAHSGAPRCTEQPLPDASQRLQGQRWVRLAVAGGLCSALGSSPPPPALLLFIYFLGYFLIPPFFHGCHSPTSMAKTRRKICFIFFLAST